MRFSNLFLAISIAFKTAATATPLSSAKALKITRPVCFLLGLPTKPLGLALTKVPALLRFVINCSPALGLLLLFRFLPLNPVPYFLLKVAADFCPKGLLRPATSNIAPGALALKILAKPTNPNLFGLDGVVL
jgi:hypothetical protein